MVAAAGSLLGITVHEGSGYPVGKVNALDLYPLSFREFLVATGNRALCDLIDSGDADLISSFSNKFVPLLRQYCYVGGMPEAVSSFLVRGLLDDAREVQLEVLRGYELDMSKPGSPLAPYADDTAFKLFLVDVGLLGAMAGLDRETVVGGNRIFEEFKGSLTERCVCQQLVFDCGLTPHYWSAENSSGEIDFLAQRSNSVYAIEVKAEENLRAKSLRAFKEPHPEIKSVRFSLSGYCDHDAYRLGHSFVFGCAVAQPRRVGGRLRLDEADVVRHLPEYR